jgi:hypothetical protein
MAATPRPRLRAPEAPPPASRRARAHDRGASGEGARISRSGGNNPAPNLAQAPKSSPAIHCRFPWRPGTRRFSLWPRASRARGHIVFVSPGVLCIIALPSPCIRLIPPPPSRAAPF